MRQDTWLEAPSDTSHVGSSELAPEGDIEILPGFPLLASELKRFTAPALPGAAQAEVEQYAEPVYWVPRHADPRPTGRFRKPVAVVRMRTGSPVLKLDLGERPVGLYVVRVVGAVETSQLRPFRQPLFIRMAVNDGPALHVSPAVGLLRPVLQRRRALLPFPRAASLPRGAGR